MGKIDKIFLNSKIMSLDLFLEKTLYDKKFGYYQKKILLKNWRLCNCSEYFKYILRNDNSLGCKFLGKFKKA